MMHSDGSNDLCWKAVGVIWWKEIMVCLLGPLTIGPSQIVLPVKYTEAERLCA